MDNVGFCVGAAWYSAQQECDFERADAEFVALRSLWIKGWFERAFALPIFPFYAITAPFVPDEVGGA